MPFTPGAGTAYPVSLSEIGIAIESATQSGKGTLAAAPTYMIPVTSPKYKPDQAYIPDETLVGSMVQINDMIQGMRYDAHGWDAPPYLDSFPVFVRAEFGSTDTKTTAPTSTTLSTGASAGASTISTAASIAANSWITIGSGQTLETHFTTNVSGAGPYTVTLQFPLINAQVSGAAVTGLTKHQFSLLNNANQGQPPSVSMWDYTGEQWRTLAACQIDELTIKGNATGLVTYTCTWFANAAALGASAPATSYTSVETALPWTYTLALAGSQVQTTTEWQLDFKRQTKPVPALTGQQGYLEYFAGPMLSTGKVTFLEQSGSPYLGDYLNNTKQSFDLTFFDPAGNAANYHSTTSLFITGEIDRTNRTEWVTVPVDCQFLPSATDATAGGKSPGEWTIANAVTTTY